MSSIPASTRSTTTSTPTGTPARISNWRSPPPDDTSPGVDPALASAVNAIGPDFPSAIAAHIASGGTAPAVEFPLDGPWVARTGPHCALGRWVTYTDQEGVERRRWESITTWIAYREVERLGQFQ